MLAYGALFLQQCSPWTLTPTLLGSPRRVAHGEDCGPPILDSLTACRVRPALDSISGPIGGESRYLRRHQPSRVIHSAVY